MKNAKNTLAAVVVRRRFFEPRSVTAVVIRPSRRRNGSSPANAHANAIQKSGPIQVNGGGTAGV
jgi:hypothetical protein